MGVILTILGILTVEGITVGGSLLIGINAFSDIMIKILDKGYRIDQDKLCKITDDIDEKKSSALVSTINQILLFIPGVNLINAHFKGKRYVKTVINDPNINAALVPLTDYEKELYSAQKTKSDKIAFFGAVSNKSNENQEFVGYSDDKPVFIEKGVCILDYNPLPYMSYTYDEVMKLASSTSFSAYKLGKLEGRNVAIIAFDVDDPTFERVRIQNTPYPREDVFYEMSDEEAKNQRFVVFPYIDEMENIEPLEKAYNEIVEERDRNNSSNSTYSSMISLENNGLTLQLK